VSIGRESLGVGVFRKGSGDFHHHRSIGRVQRAAISSARLGVDQQCVRECPLKRALIAYGRRAAVPGLDRNSPQNSLPFVTAQRPRGSRSRRPPGISRAGCGANRRHKPLSSDRSRSKVSQYAQSAQLGTSSNLSR
jgi:hypothetical protein